MKASIPFAIAVACALSAPLAWAQEKPASRPPAGMGMHKAMPPMHENMKENMKGNMKENMKENMASMQQQMDKIHATTDPVERRKLMQDHMQAMQSHMKSMRGMGGPMTMDHGAGGGMPMGGPMKMDHGVSGGMAKGGKKDMAGGDMMQHHKMMEGRMDMMQMMMEQMLQHTQAKE